MLDEVYCPYCGYDAGPGDWFEEVESVPYEIYCHKCGRYFQAIWERTITYEVVIPNELKVCERCFNWEDDKQCCEFGKYDYRHYEPRPEYCPLKDDCED